MVTTGITGITGITVITCITLYRYVIACKDVGVFEQSRDDLGRLDTMTIGFGADNWQLKFVEEDSDSIRERWLRRISNACYNVGYRSAATSSKISAFPVLHKVRQQFNDDANRQVSELPIAPPDKAVRRSSKTSDIRTTSTTDASNTMTPPEAPGIKSILNPISAVRRLSGKGTEGSPAPVSTPSPSAPVTKRRSSISELKSGIGGVVGGIFGGSK